MLLLLLLGEQNCSIKRSKGNKDLTFILTWTRKQ